MKKLLLFSVPTIGAVSASQAGVRFGFDLRLPFPPLPGITISHPAPLPVYTRAAPVVCEPQPAAVYQAPIWTAPVAPPVYQTAPAVVIEHPRTYVDFSSADCRANPHHYFSEQFRRDYPRNTYHFDRERFDHPHNGNRW